jgi:hypothetical protein
MSIPIPKVGDSIYVDDVDVVHQTYVRGGIGKVSEVYWGFGRVYIRVEELPGASWAWEYLAPLQDGLREEYGSIRAGKYIIRSEDARSAEPGVAPDRGGM